MRLLTILRWCISQTVRNACAAHKHFERQIDAQRDILPADAIAEMRVKLDALTIAVRSGIAGEMNAKMAELRAVAGERLIPYPHGGWREGMEVVIVALAVAMSIRTFFLQPFKIPSASMQPTLFGVTTRPDFSDAIDGLDRIEEMESSGQGARPRLIYRTQVELAQQVEAQKTIVIPHGWERLKQWIHGYTYLHFAAPADGKLEAVPGPWPGGVLSLYQKIKFGGQWYTLWFPPDYGDYDLRHRAGLTIGRPYRRGDDVIKLMIGTGDHLLVDRLSYNFCKPERGDVVVFTTVGTQIRDPDEDYIKRLIALPGEHVQIGDDRHVIINGERLDESTPHFDKVYGFEPTQPPQESAYSGHINGTVAREFRLGRDLAPLFPDAQTVFTNGPGSYLFMGDNTCNSSDSRYWGQVPVDNVIGKSFFVYWPLSRRFGLNHD